MTCSQPEKSVRRIGLALTIAVTAIAIYGIANATPAQAQTYNVLYNFPSGVEGSDSTLLIDGRGRLYGTLFSTTDCTPGLIFQLQRSGSGWTFNPLHCFDNTDGYGPLDYGGLTVGPDGSFYGTTDTGGATHDGVVFKINPGATACTTALCPWTMTTLYTFSGDPDGSVPSGNVVFDAAGNLYGTTSWGGAYQDGSVFEMTPSGSGWSESILYSFRNYPQGVLAGVILDNAGNLYGVDYFGGSGSCTSGCGYVFELTGSTGFWSERPIYQFTGGADGNSPVGGLVLDQAGNLYGSTYRGGSGGGGTIFELSPSGGGWTLTTLCNFAGDGGPESPLTMDAAGNLYGTTQYDGHGVGSVFKATRSGNSWTCSDLYDFEIGSQGYQPVGGVALDSSGNLFGTASAGGTNGNGVVWEIAP